MADGELHQISRTIGLMEGQIRAIEEDVRQLTTDVGDHIRPSLHDIKNLLSGIQPTLASALGRLDVAEKNLDMALNAAHAAKRLAEDAKKQNSRAAWMVPGAAGGGVAGGGFLVWAWEMVQPWLRKIGL